MRQAKLDALLVIGGTFSGIFDCFCLEMANLNAMLWSFFLHLILAQRLGTLFTESGAGDRVVRSCPVNDGVRAPACHYCTLYFG